MREMKLGNEWIITDKKSPATNMGMAKVGLLY